MGFYNVRKNGITDTAPGLTGAVKRNGGFREMANELGNKFPFFFEYNIHKSTIPLGVEDTDYRRLAATYGVGEETVLEQVAAITASKEKNAKRLLQSVCSADLKKLENKRVAFLGDSNTSFRKSYMNLIRTALQDIPGFQAKDCSVSGNRVGNLVYNMYPNIHSLHADIAHVMIGGNDMRRTDGPLHVIMTEPDHFYRCLDFVVTGLVEDGTKVILSTVAPVCLPKLAENQKGWRSEFREEDRLEFNDQIRKLAAKHNVFLNDMESTFNQYTPAELTVDDGMHLSELGQQLLAERVLQAILEVSG